MHADTRRHYRAQAAETAGPAQLVLMLYDGALAGLARARQVEGPEAVNRELTRVQDIVSELLLTLDRERGGQVAANLAALYDFCLDRLVEANVRKDLRLLDAVQTTLAQLREAWERACCGSPVAG